MITTRSPTFIGGVLALLCALQAGSARGQQKVFTGFTCRRTYTLVQLQERPGLKVTRPRRAWGTRLVIRRLEQVADGYRGQFPAAAPIHVRDISRRRAGKLSGHGSHCSGQDVDIQLPLKHTAAYVDATGETLDLKRAWYLVTALLSTCDVEFIFIDRELQRALRSYARRRHTLPPGAEGWLFQYPHRGPRGVVRHWPNHKNHLHVRFRRRRAMLHLHGASMLCKTLTSEGGQGPGGANLIERLFSEHSAALRAEH